MKCTLPALAVGLALSASAAMADCTIWAVEDSSAGRQVRTRIFANSDLTERDQLLAEAHGIATRAARQGADFVDVFLTRPQDGTNRSYHNMMTSTVWLRYNPGGTPVIDGEMSANVLDVGATGEMEYDTLMGSRSDLEASDIEAILATAPSGVADICES